MPKAIAAPTVLTKITRTKLIAIVTKLRIPFTITLIFNLSIAASTPPNVAFRL